MTFRVLPRHTPETEFFWTSGADGKLRFQRCTTCGLIVHPPGPLCPACRTRTLEPSVLSGRGTVASFTINLQPWGVPEFNPPYVVALVEIEEDPRVRLMTNIVGCPPEDVRIGIAVEVEFLEHDGTYLPLFRPVSP